jgi:dipeptidyl-peptidase-4
LDWVYPEELDLRTAYWWSPDSSQIAYLQMDERPVTKYPLVNFLTPTAEVETMRYPKAGEANPVVRVGVVALKGGETRWMETGTDPSVYIARVNWLRDSRRLAIQRLSRAQTQLDLLLADSTSGSAQVILTERDPSWINLHDDLYFFADGQRFLWSSERDGFCHLYLYDLSGKVLRQLTRGSWEVTQVAAVDEGEGAVYFLATQKSPIERHLYKLRASDGIATRMTREDGTHSIRMSPDARRFVDTYSNAMTPPREDLYRADGTLVLAVNENKVAELAEYGLQPVEFFAVRGADGTELNAMVIKPPDFDPARKYPVLVYTYGGPHAQVVRNAWAGASFLWHQMMAQNGYIIFALDNRGSGGRGHAFESYLHGKFGETELADQLAGVNYLKSLPYVDSSRIGIWGWSYGGYMTCYAMTRAPETFKAGFAGAPVTDWRQYDTIYTERYLGRPQENPEGYKNSSPVSYVAQLKGKLLVAHGTGDDNVHFANSVELSQALIEARRYAEILIYPGRGHGISDAQARVHLFLRVTRFFLENL